MARRTMIGGLATLAMAAGGSVVGAGAARAAIVDYDNVELETVNFDFGSAGLGPERAERSRRPPLAPHRRAAQAAT